MGEGVGLRCFGARWENGKFSDRIYWKKQRSKFVWLRKTFVSRNQDRRATPTIEEELSFEVGDFVYLKVSPMRGLRRFKVRDKLAPRFIGPFKILEKRGEVTYQL
jgi:hypothetical protein